MEYASTMPMSGNKYDAQEAIKKSDYGIGQDRIYNNAGQAVCTPLRFDIPAGLSLREPVWRN